MLSPEKQNEGMSVFQCHLDMELCQRKNKAVVTQLSLPLMEDWPVEGWCGKDPGNSVVLERITISWAVTATGRVLLWSFLNMFVWTIRHSVGGVSESPSICNRQWAFTGCLATSQWQQDSRNKHYHTDAKQHATKCSETKICKNTGAVSEIKEHAAMKLRTGNIYGRKFIMCFYNSSTDSPHKYWINTALKMNSTQ